LFRAREKKPQKIACGKNVEKNPKNTKNEYVLSGFMPKKEKCLNYFQKTLDILPEMWYNIGKKT
jgi:hypothetical protein